MANEEVKDLGTGGKIGLYVSLALCVIGIIFSAYRIFTGSDAISSINMVALVNYVIVVFYALFFYNKPHGNALRYVYLLFAVNTAVIASRMAIISYAASDVMFIAIVIVAFMSGRLNRLRQNNILATVVLVLFIIASAVASVVWNGIFSFTAFIIWFGPVLQWLAIVCVYNCRYMEHKAAGFEEK